MDSKVHRLFGMMLMIAAMVPQTLMAGGEAVSASDSQVSIPEQADNPNFTDLEIDGPQPDVVTHSLPDWATDEVTGIRSLTLPNGTLVEQLPDSQHRFRLSRDDVAHFEYLEISTRIARVREAGQFRDIGEIREVRQTATLRNEDGDLIGEYWIDHTPIVENGEVVRSEFTMTDFSTKMEASGTFTQGNGDEVLVSSSSASILYSDGSNIVDRFSSTLSGQSTNLLGGVVSNPGQLNIAWGVVLVVVVVVLVVIAASGINSVGVYGGEYDCDGWLDRWWNNCT